MTNKSKPDGGSGTELLPQPRTGAKEAYQQPHLTVYGNIREITKGMTPMGMQDGIFMLMS